VRRFIPLLPLLLACRREPPPRPIRPRVTLPPEAPVVIAQPEPTALMRIPGHAPGDAGIPPAPDPRGAALLGWDLAPFDDGFGRDDVAWLILTERTPDGRRRDLVNVGARAQCRELAPPMLRAGGDAGLVSAVRSVRCEQPEPAEFHLARGGDGVWWVARAGCVHPSRACGQGRAPEDVVGRATVPAAGLTARLAGALARRDEGPAMPAAEVVRPAREVVVRLVETDAIDDATGLAAHNLTLFAAGRRVDFGAVTACRAPTAAERRTYAMPAGALVAVVCETPDEGTRPVAVTRAGDMLSVRTRAPEGGAAVITQRVGLVPGSAVTAAR